MTVAQYILLYVASALLVTIVTFGITTFFAARRSLAAGDNELLEVELNVLPYIIGGIAFLPIVAPAIALFFVLEFACSTGAQIAIFYQVRNDK